MARLFAQPHQNYNQNMEQPSLKPSETKLNGSLTTTKLKKPHPPRRAGGAQTLNGLVPHLCVLDKNSGGTSWEQGVPAPHQALQPSFQCQKEKSLQLLAAKSGD